MKLVYEMTKEEQDIYIRKKAINKVMNKINNKFKERLVNLYGK
jgi:hypothetical protein